jgi:adenine-specific DNA methylase
VILAALWPDPADPLCPPRFLDEAQQALKDTKGTAVNVPARDYCKPENVRQGLLDFIAEFANWDKSTSRDYLAFARRLVQVAHEALGGEPGTRPLVVDPFAGGGSIPLEALRVGADAFASDLNPVAVLLNKVVLEYIPRYGQRLADEVRKWGAWVKEQAEKELAEFYPKDLDGATPIAYLWARTIRCEGPGCGAEVPLIRSLWLAKRVDRSMALQLVPNPRAKRVDFRIICKKPGGWVNQDDHSEKITAPRFDGTAKRGAVTCPCWGYTTPVTRVREQLKPRRGGTDSATLLAVMIGTEGKVGRQYRLANSEDILAADAAKSALRRIGKSAEDKLIPYETFSGLEPRRIPLPQYGMRSFGDIYPPRALVTLISFSRLVRGLHDELSENVEPGLSDAVATILALVVDRQADKLSSIARWDNSRENPQGTFARQALPMVWDFSETNPFSGAGGDWETALAWVLQVVEQEAKSHLSCGTVERCSATHQSLPNDSADAIVTDPPYYYFVPYSDLSDFFMCGSSVLCCTFMLTCSVRRSARRHKNAYRI